MLSRPSGQGEHTRKLCVDCLTSRVIGWIWNEGYGRRIIAWYTYVESKVSTLPRGVWEDNLYGRHVWFSLLFGTVPTRRGMAASNRVEANTISNRRKCISSTLLVLRIIRSKLSSSRSDSCKEKVRTRSFVIYILIHNTTPPPLLRKQVYQQIPYLHFYSSCPPTDYAIKSWVMTQYLSMHHTSELK